MTTLDLIKKIKEKSRNSDVIIYRQCIMYVLFKQIGLTYYRISKMMGLDTDTVRNSCKRFCDYIDVNDTFARLALKEVQKHTIDSDLINIYIDGLNINDI